jgi:hypothetical protein
MQEEQLIERDEIINEVCELAGKLATLYQEPPCYWTVAMLRRCYQQSYAAFAEARRARQDQQQWWVLHYADMALYALCCQAQGSCYELEDFQAVTQALNRALGCQITLRRAADAAIARHSLYLRRSLPSREDSRRAVLQALQIEA